MDVAWMKERKKALRITDDAIAEALGVERSVANKVANGKVTMNYRRASAAAALFQVPVAEMLFRAGLSDQEPEGDAPAMGELEHPHQRLAWARQRAGYDSKADFAKAVEVDPTTYRAYENGQNGYSKLAAQFARKLGVTAEWLLEGGEPPNTTSSRVKAAQQDEVTDTVGIQQIDYAYGMGAAFNDSPVQVEVMQFPRMWVETITYSPPELLTWARGRGDSMSPTIYDGDLLMIDRSQKKVQEQDAIWAFMVGDVGSVKRLRVKGDRFIILSDNPTIPDDEEPQDFVTIIGRVVFVGAKK